MIEFERVGFAYFQSPPLFEDVNLQLAPGRFYLVKGPSGSGKSSLLRLINRLEEPTSGRMLYQGRPYADYSAPLLRRGILYLQQTPTAVDASVRENLTLAFRLKANQDLVRPGDDHLRTMLDRFLLDGVGLDENALALSVGQLQRVCLIRSLLLSPDVILLDEPTSALDEDSAAVVEQAAVDSAEAGRTVVMISHRRFAPKNLDFTTIDVSGGRIAVG
jgi:putative ABC transport system ATP-binding protein